MSVLPVSQNKRRALFRNLLIAAIAVLAVLAFASRVYGVDVHGFATAILLPVTLLAALQFRALDEMAKQAHYAAWYGGSFLALIAIGVIAIALSNGVVSLAPITARATQWLGSGAESLFIAGLLSGPVLMLAGYLIWSAVHWLRMR